MADAAAAVNVDRRDPGVSAYPIANGVTVYEGMLASLEGGYLNHWADGANDVFVGPVEGGGVGLADETILLGDTGATPVPEARVDERGLILMHLDSVGDTPTQAKVGDLVYCSSSNPDDMTLDSTGRTHPIGWLKRFRLATDVDVHLFTPSEMLAQATA